MKVDVKRPAVPVNQENMAYSFGYDRDRVCTFLKSALKSDAHNLKLNAVLTIDKINFFNKEILEQLIAIISWDESGSICEPACKAIVSMGRFDISTVDIIMEHVEKLDSDNAKSDLCWCIGEVISHHGKNG